MNYMFANEECSSGCESGWTLYLQHSSISGDFYEREYDLPEPPSKRSNEEEDEDEDLSMISDASSGPPQLHEADEEGNAKDGCSYQYSETLSLSNTRNKNKDKIRGRKKVEKHYSSLLDDTASSPLYDFCNKARSQASLEENVVEYSQGYSSTQFDVRPPYQEEHYDFLQSGNQVQQQNQWFEGKRW